MTNGNTVRLDFHSTFEMLDFVQVVSDHLGRLAGLDDEALHWVGVAVRESVINAIKHGNGGDEHKHVHVEFTPLDVAAGRRASSFACATKAPASIPRPSPIRWRPRTCSRPAAAASS